MYSRNNRKARKLAEEIHEAIENAIAISSTNDLPMLLALRKSIRPECKKLKTGSICPDQAKRILKKIANNMLDYYGKKQS